MLTDKQILDHWYEEIYDRFETDTNDIAFLLKTLGEEPKCILEACCGSGRLLVPIAKAGHFTVGFDIDDGMLARIPAKAAGLPNILLSKKDALIEAWGEGFDVVVLAGNILLNIEGSADYKEAQRLFIQKAYDALAHNGHIYLDFNLYAHPEKVFFNAGAEDRIIFEGTDSGGNSGTYRLLAGCGDAEMQIDISTARTDVITKGGRKVSRENLRKKHIPTLTQVIGWLEDSGFIPEKIYGDYEGNSIGENTSRAIIWARKGGMNDDHH